MVTAAQKKAAEDKAAADKAEAEKAAAEKARVEQSEKDRAANTGAGPADPNGTGTDDGVKNDGAPVNEDDVTKRASGPEAASGALQSEVDNEALAEALEANDGVPYQARTAIVQARNELENARALGQITLAEAASKRLRALGADVPDEDEGAPRGRRSAPKSTTNRD